jgi:hypothetical protein
MSEGKPWGTVGPPMRLSIATCGHIADVGWRIPSKSLFKRDLSAIAP